MTVNPTTKTALAAADADVERAANALDTARQEIASLERLLAQAEDRQSDLKTALEIAMDARTATAIEVYAI